MSLQDLAKKAGVTSQPEAAVTTEQPKTSVGDLVGKAKEKAPKKEKAAKPAIVREAVNEGWIEQLTKRANDKFGGQERFGGASVEFTVAKSKNRFVSMTPKLVFDDGTVKSAGATKRVGFCTSKDWDAWDAKVEESLEHAYSTERKTPKARKPTGQWAAHSAAVKEVIADASCRSVSSRLVVRKENDRVSLKREGDAVLVGSASGSFEFIETVLNAVKNIPLPAKSDTDEGTTDQTNEGTDPAAAE